VLERGGQDLLDQTCEKRVSITQKQGGKKYPTYSKEEEANWIGHIWRRNCLLKYGKVGKTEVTGRRGRRRNNCSMTVRKGNCKSHCVENSLGKRL